jgi:hypothetical protein
LGGPLVDVVEEADGEVLVDAARADVGCMEAGPRDPFIELLVWVRRTLDRELGGASHHQLLPFFKSPQERSQCADVYAETPIKT